MKPAVLEGGVLTIAREAIEELARRKGFNLELSLSSEGIVAALTIPMGIIDVPAKVRLTRIRVEGTRIVGDDLAISTTVFPVPLSILASYTSKYPYLALDADQNKIYVDLNQLIPGYIALNIKEIRIIKDAVQLHLFQLVLEKIPNI